MKSRVLLLSLTVLLLAGAAQAQTFGAVLTTSQETPPVTNSSGFGNSTVVLDSTHTSLAVNITVSKLTGAPILAHIHKAPFGVAGPVVINFDAPTNFSNGVLNKTFTITKAIGDDLALNPSQYYVNVHTPLNGGGEVRGQLSAISGTTFNFSGELRGSNEVPGNASTGFGAYFLSFDTQAGVLTWEINVGKLANPTLSHLHKAAAGVSGGVVIGFALSSAGFVNGRVTGSVPIANIDPALLADILANPQLYYVNVHTTAFPAGELRGQLSATNPVNEYDIGVAGKVAGAVGTNFVTDVRVFNPSYDNAAAVLVEYFPTGQTNTAASASLTVNLPPRGTAVLDDVNGTTSLNTPAGIGGLRVSGPSKLAVTSRIYNDQRAAAKGTFGQFVPAIPRANELRRGVLPQLSNHTDLTTGFRTNIGFFNPSNENVSVRLELHDETGTLLGSSPITLSPLSQQQNGIGGYFSGIDLSNRLNLTMSFDAAAPIVAYASVVDNVSTDQIFVVAQEDAGVATAP